MGAGEFHILIRGIAGIYNLSQNPGPDLGISRPGHI